MQCFFDTPGLMLKQSGFASADIKIRNESAWSSVSLYDVLIVVFDVQRHITRCGSLFQVDSYSTFVFYLINFPKKNYSFDAFLNICPLPCTLVIDTFF